MERVLRITSHVGHGRYLRTLGFEAVGYIVRHRDISSPYASSPTHLVYRDPERGLVIIVETAHKRYDVFAVPADEKVYATDDEATDAFMALLKAEVPG